MEHGANKIKRRIETSIQLMAAGLILLAPSGLFGRPLKPVNIDVLIRSLMVNANKTPPMLLADQHQGSTPGAGSNKSEEKSATESKPKTDSGKAEAKTQKKKSIKPFRPSERISADQAVDFPSDI